MESRKKFVLTKYPHKNIYLKVLGGYVTDTEKEVILSAGWREDTTPLPKLSDEILQKSPYLETETYYAPAGTDLFGAHTKAEAEKYKKAIREAFRNAGITLYFRKGNLRELL